MMRSFITLYFSLKIIRMTKSRRMRWAEYEGRIGEKRKVCPILVRKPVGQTQNYCVFGLVHYSVF
jgi:hypothetical protein